MPTKCIAINLQFTECKQFNIPKNATAVSAAGCSYGSEKILKQTLSLTFDEYDRSQLEDGGLKS